MLSHYDVYQPWSRSWGWGWECACKGNHEYGGDPQTRPTIGTLLHHCIHWKGSEFQGNLNKKPRRSIMRRLLMHPQMDMLTSYHPVWHLSSTHIQEKHQEKTESFAFQTSSSHPHFVAGTPSFHDSKGQLFHHAATPLISWWPTGNPSANPNYSGGICSCKCSRMLTQFLNGSPAQW